MRRFRLDPFGTSLVLASAALAMMGCQTEELTTVAQTSLSPPAEPPASPVSFEPVLEPGERAFFATVEGAAWLRTGDRIDLLVSLDLTGPGPDGETIVERVAFTPLHDIEVLHVMGATGESVAARRLALRLSAEAGQRLLLAGRLGTIRASLRHPDDRESPPMYTSSTKLRSLFAIDELDELARLRDRAKDGVLSDGARDDRPATRVPAGLRAVSLEIEAPLDGLVAGRRVDLLTALVDEASRDLTVLLVLEDLPVLDVLETAAGSGAALLLLMAPAEAERAHLAGSSGPVMLALRGLGDAERPPEARQRTGLQNLVTGERTQAIFSGRRQVEVIRSSHGSTAEESGQEP